MGKFNALAAKKGLPKFSMNYNQLSSYDADDIQDYANEIEIAEVVHHRRNLYGKGAPDYRPHGDTKAKTQEHVDFRQRMLSYEDYVDILNKRWVCIYDSSDDAQPDFASYPYVLPKMGSK